MLSSRCARDPQASIHRRHINVRDHRCCIAEEATPTTSSPPRLDESHRLCFLLLHFSNQQGRRLHDQASHRLLQMHPSDGDDRYHRQTRPLARHRRRLPISIDAAASVVAGQGDLRTQRCWVLIPRLRGAVPYGVDFGIVLLAASREPSPRSAPCAP